MNIILLKLYSLFHETKEMFHVHFSQYLIVTYRSRPIVVNKNYDNKILRRINIFLLMVYSIYRIIFLGILYFFKILTSLLIVKDKGIVGIVFSFIRIAIFLIPLSLTGLYLYLSGDVDPAKLKFYQGLHSYRTATAISDNYGHLIGAIQSPLASPSKSINHQQRIGTLYVNDVPNVFWDVLRAQEDKHLSFNDAETGLLDILFFRKDSYKGIHLTSLLKKPFSFISSTETSFTQVSLMRQIIKNLYGDRYFEQQCSVSFFKEAKIKFFDHINKGFTRACRDLEYLQAGRHLFPYLARFNGLEFKRWSAMHTPMLVSNSDAYGLRSISATIFGKKVEKLNEAQQALLATSYLYNLQFPLLELGKRSDALEREQWQKLSELAIVAVEIAYRETQSNKADKIIQNIKAIELPPKPKIPRQFVNYIENIDSSQQKKYTDLFKRNALFIEGFDSLIVSRLKEIYKGIGESRAVTDLIITLPVIENNRFIKNINSAMQGMIDRCRSCFNKLPGNDPLKNGALMKIIVSDEQGKIIRHYKKGNVSRRSIASVAKLPASILLASFDDKANTKYCNREYKGLKNETGPFKYGIKNCSSLKRRGYAFTFKDAFAVSKNLPFFYALTEQHQISKEILMALYRDFNIKDSMSLQGNAPSLEQLSFDLSFGKAESTPQDVHKFTHKISQTLFNSEFEADPFAVDQFLVADFNKSVESYYSGALTSVNTIQQYLKLSATKAELRKILRAPVYNQEGTLRSFQNISGVRFLFAKSGTSSTKSRQVKEKWVVGAFKVNARIYTFLIFIGTDSDDTNGLGNRISHRTLIYPIMNEIVKSLSR